MATYYLSSVDGNDADDGSTWDLAKATLAGALAVATGGSDVIKVDSAHSESLAADTTYTLSANVRVISVNRAASDVPLAGAVIGAQPTNYGITIAGAYVSYWYGITLSTGGGSVADHLMLANTDGCHCEMESCTLWLKDTHPTSSIQLCCGSTSSTLNAFARYRNCVFKFGATGQKIRAIGWAELIGCSIDPGGSAPTTLFFPGYNGEPGCRMDFVGCDFSPVTGTFLGNSTYGHVLFVLRNCRLGAAVTLKAAATTVLNKGNSEVYAFNCDSGDAHYAMYHGDAFGETTVSNTIYANDGARYDGTNKCSWKIVTTANCSFYYPYKSPWIDLYHDGTSAITPSLEILRDGSSTAYQDDEVWGEWSYQGTGGYPLATIVDDRMTPLGTPANQATGALDASGWTGENATAWFGKLAPAAFTPAEIGHLRCRVCVGEPSITVYADPTFRGLSVTQGMSRVTPSGWVETMIPLSTDPGEGNVESGVTYTINDVAKEGAFVVPTEDQVESGVGFGADGTEYTGTLEAGGGTGGYVPVSGGGIQGVFRR